MHAAAQQLSCIGYIAYLHSKIISNFSKLNGRIARTHVPMQRIGIQTD